MSAPKLVMTGKMPRPMTLAELHETVTQADEAVFAKDGELAPKWLIATGDGKMIAIETPWEDGREKHAATTMVRMLLEITKATHYSFSSEVWVAAIDKVEGKEEAFKAKLNWVQQHGVMALPRSEREEKLIVLTAERGGKALLSNYLISSGSKKPFLGPRMDETHELEGRMSNLFDQPVDSTEMQTALAFVKQFMAGMKQGAESPKH